MKSDLMAPETKPLLEKEKPGALVAAGVQDGLLRTERLMKEYRHRRVVNGVSISVAAGEIVGLLGPNGAGKTTTSNMVVGLISVEQNILAILETCKMNRQERAVRLKYLLGELDMARLAGSVAYTLSGGEKRRLEITRALVTSPKLLLLDEPFSGIDPIAVYEVQKIVRRLKERGLGILITDHNVRETLKLVDRAYLIHKGEVVYEGSAEQLVNDPKAREIYLGPDFNL